jgi:hypothetical protein
MKRVSAPSVQNARWDDLAAAPFSNGYPTEETQLEHQRRQRQTDCVDPAGS